MANGILNVLKPANMTSHQVVAYIRKKLKLKKVGHTGTLDPMATGILPISIGKATRVSEYVTDLTKSYRAEITFGLVSDTGDLDGEIRVLEQNPKIDEEELKSVLKELTGTITQVPPKASAIKVKGKKLYEYYREGLEVEIPSREVTIYSLKLVEGFPLTSNKGYIDIHCSKGTYIRTLCQDIGEKLGTGALMSYLIRTAVGPFNLTNALFLHQITEENYLNHLQPMDLVLTHLDKVVVPKYIATKIANGLCIKTENLYSSEVRVYDEANNFIAICKNVNGMLKPHKVFN
ncbi:tRNA pseudouridine(55) synthase TruB [Anaerobranca gottschalkii]|uniref:tRNA pseudouridine synthase B n=1 Tax=Anaerobranca gottschalkii DSM 13577 TaxID=1120990 RepID=A0A1H9Z9Q9_9FIRM|nr:tRNA pseudouridine(55) synthase TruB [Anaerobranca gottschalkii]SES78078.1 tRNA pseudouridine55 synthase [Anaerobranca gottschalkii DSM 13577]